MINTIIKNTSSIIKQTNNVIPNTTYSSLNPNVKDRNIGEIDFEDPDITCGPGEVYYSDEENEEELFNEGYGAKKLLR